MNKIKAYILNGKGIGALLLFALAFVASVYLSLNMRSTLIDFIPLAQGIADDVLPIEVKNGVVVTPEDTVKVIDLNEDDADQSAKIPLLVVDTTQDTLDTSTLPQGLYLSRTTLYVVKSDEVRVIKLQDNANIMIPKQDYRDAFRTIISWSALTVAACGTVIAFLVFLLLNLFYAYLAGVAAWINKTTLAFDVKMRLNAILFTAVYIFARIMELVGFSLGLLLFVLLMFALQIAIIRRFNNN